MKPKKLKLLTVFLFLFPLCLVIIGAGCNDEELNFKNMGGLVLYNGNPSVDGCGWIVKIDTNEYSPINLDSKFQKDSLEVVLKYDTLCSSWNCGWRMSGYQEIDIKEIEFK